MVSDESGPIFCHRARDSLMSGCENATLQVGGLLHKPSGAHSGPLSQVSHICTAQPSSALPFRMQSMDLSTSNKSAHAHNLYSEWEITLYQDPIVISRVTRRCVPASGARCPLKEYWQHENYVAINDRWSFQKAQPYAQNVLSPQLATVSRVSRGSRQYFEHHAASTQPYPSQADSRSRSNQRSLHFDTAGRIHLLVLGLTGVGKSTFINHLIRLGDRDGSSRTARVGHSLMSCTKAVAEYDCEIKGRPFTLIDTPGFDDTHRSDIEVLRMIADFTTKYSNSGKEIHGIVFLHRITDVRLSASAIRMAEIAKRLCGEEFYGRVAMVTTMWQLLPDEELGHERVADLLRHPKFWADFAEARAPFYSFRNSLGSAEKIIDAFGKSLSKGKLHTLRIQTELVSDRRRISETAAGDFLEGELLRRRQQHQAEIHRIQEEIRQAQQEHDFDSSDLLSRSLDTKRAQVRRDDLQVRGFRE